MVLGETLSLDRQEIPLISCPAPAWSCFQHSMVLIFSILAAIFPRLWLCVSYSFLVFLR